MIYVLLNNPILTPPPSPEKKIKTNQYDDIIIIYRRFHFLNMHLTLPHIINHFKRTSAVRFIFFISLSWIINCAYVQPLKNAKSSKSYNYKLILSTCCVFAEPFIMLLLVPRNIEVGRPVRQYVIYPYANTFFLSLLSTNFIFDSQLVAINKGTRYVN